MAVGVLRAAHELGIAIPGELAVAGCDDTYVSEVSSPRLGTIHAPLLEMAAEAVNLIIAQEHLKATEAPAHLKHLLPEAAPMRLVLPFRIAHGASIAAPPQDGL